MMAVAAAQKNREMFAIKKSYSVEVSLSPFTHKSFLFWIVEEEKNEEK